MHSYTIARGMVKLTGIIFITQLIIEVSGVAVRREAFEYVTHIFGALFFASIAYSVVLIVLSAIKRRNKST